MSVKNNSRKVITELVFSGFDNVEKPLAVGVVMLILYMLSLTANIANISFIITDKRLHQPMYIFICNLAFVDILHCTSSCPTMIGILLVGYKIISYEPCMAQMFIFHFAVSMESFAIAAMSFDRFIAISMPFKYSSIMTIFRCVLISISLWFVAAAILSMLPASIVGLPICYSTAKYMFCDYATITRATCVNPEPYFNNASILTSCVLVGTFSFILLSYLKIAIVVLRMTSNTDKKKAINTCASHIIVIICYYVPTFTRIVLTRLGVSLTLQERNGLMVGSILIPSVVNPFIYCFRTKEIRNNLFRLFLKVEPLNKK